MKLKDSTNCFLHISCANTQKLIELIKNSKNLNTKEGYIFDNEGPDTIEAYIFNKENIELGVIITNIEPHEDTYKFMVKPYRVLTKADKKELENNPLLKHGSRLLSNKTYDFLLNEHICIGLRNKKSCILSTEPQRLINFSDNETKSIDDIDNPIITLNDTDQKLCKFYIKCAEAKILILKLQQRYEQIAAGEVLTDITVSLEIPGKFFFNKNKKYSATLENINYKEKTFKIKNQEYTYKFYEDLCIIPNNPKCREQDLKYKYIKEQQIKKQQK